MANMLAMHQTHHVRVGNKRTTISIDALTAELLAIKLNTKPETKEVKKAIRLWLQHQLDEDNDPDRVYVSQWLKKEAILHLVDKNLSEKHTDWTLSDLY